MSIGWVLHRDWVRVDQAFADELHGVLASHRVAPGSTLVLVARSVRHAPEFVLRVVDHPFVVITETYDGNDGAIDTSGITDRTGAGSPASDLSLYALSATNVRLIARGGSGAAGGAGGRGALVTFRALAPTGIQAQPELLGRGGATASTASTAATAATAGLAGASVTPSLSWYTRSAQWRGDVAAVLGTHVAEIAA